MKGLVLEGGGTKGAYQIGAYKALRDLGIEFQGVAGTSIGALNGAYIIQNDIEIMEDIWLTYDYTHFMNIDEETYEKYKNVDFTAKNINSVIELINKARKNEGIDISPLRELLEKTLNEDIIRKSNKDFGLVTVWWDKKINPHPLYKMCIRDSSYTYYNDYKEKLQVSVSGQIWLDITDKGVNKGLAINKLQELLNIKHEETMVFGDYLNDLEMMESAYHSYAMENAHDDLKKVARFRAKKNTENGVVEKIKEVLNI